MLDVGDQAERVDVTVVDEFDGPPELHAHLLDAGRSMLGPRGALRAIVVDLNWVASVLTAPDQRCDELRSVGVAAVDRVVLPVRAEPVVTALRSKLRGCRVVMAPGRRVELQRLAEALSGGNVLLHDATAIDRPDVGVVRSRARQHLRVGDVAAAAHALGARYALAGEVVHGRQLGRELGFPTANLVPSRRVVLPHSGVYAAWASCGGTRWPAAVNIGRRPTVGGDDPHDVVEAHLIDAAIDLYGRTLRLEFVQRLRAEVRFPSLDSLRGQLACDVERARDLLESPRAH